MNQQLLLKVHELRRLASARHIFLLCFRGEEEEVEDGCYSMLVMVVVSRKSGHLLVVEIVAREETSTVLLAECE